MIQIGELIDLITSVVLTLYLIKLIKDTRTNTKSFWFLGILLILLSKFLSVIEVFFIPVTINLVEHFSFMLASIMFAISVYQKEL
ncbi:hypothetical protein [Carboxylicivirga caseinilyticus]|uniref:hypothetical protein n=1 Tax=Carboxylicivirga caseinilyticus TaxID=3417572 RepID=UPI003D32F856|nr:hypothetical protein [Marinilabiliaceae bacterium A049]